MNIGFFDSGIGGITVLTEAIRQLPTEDFVYYADTLHVPYGTKSKEEVRKHVQDSVDAILQENVKALVIACNTATSIAVSELRANYSIPIIGMEPAVKPAVEMNRSSGKRVLVLATSLTLKQSKYNELVSRVDDQGHVDSLPLPELVEFCEHLQFDNSTIRAYFHDKLADFDLDQYGTIVLGCTHYPFYQDMLASVVPGHIQIIDGSKGTVTQLQHVLEANHLCNTNGSSHVEFRCSGSQLDYLEKMEKALDIYKNRFTGYPQ